MRRGVTRAPYAPGDQVKALYSDDQGTTLGVLEVDRVVPLKSHGWYRIECDRPNSVKHPRVEFIVNRSGVDVHGYVGPHRIA